MTGQWRGSGNPEHVESARLLKWAVRGTYRCQQPWFHPPLTHWMRVQRLTAPISVNVLSADFPRHVDDPEAVAVTRLGAGLP